MVGNVIELELLTREDYSLLKIDFHFRKETQRLKWFEQIKNEIDKHKQKQKPDLLSHEYDSIRPKSAILRDNRMNRDWKASISAKRSSITSFIKQLTAENEETS